MEKDITLRIAKLVDLYDNVDTPDLDQTPDSILRPGETLEDFDVRFRRPNADGGRIELKKGSQPPADTSPVYNEKTGHIFKKGNRFGTFYSKIPGTNQYGALDRTLEEVQKIIDEAPKINKKNKMVEMTKKDLVVGS